MHSSPPRLKRLLTTAAAVTALLAGSMVAAPAAHAAPVPAPDPCAHKSHDYNGEGKAYTNKDLNLKAEPASSCDNTSWIPQGTLVYYHCFYYNVHGNLWWYVRAAGSNTKYGWTSAANLYDQSSDENGDGWISYIAC